MKDKVEMKESGEFLFEKLAVWQKAMELVQLVYDQVRLFPPQEKYALTDQLRRAVVSVPSNIAEGSGRAGNRDYAHFLSIARGSLYEMLTQLEIAKRQCYISEYDSIRQLADEISRMLTAMLQKFSTLEQRT